MLKAIKIRLYPNKKQQELIEKTFGCTRFIYNQMLAEKIKVYEQLKHDKESLYSYKYKTEKDYKQEFEFLSEVSSRALQQARGNLEVAYKNFYRRVKQKSKKAGFPKFKSKKKDKDSFREPQLLFGGKQKPAIEIKDNKIKLLKLEYIKFKGLNFNLTPEEIRNVTIFKSNSGEYYASILYKKHKKIKIREKNAVIGIDLGLKEFAVLSNGNVIKGVKKQLLEIEKQIKKQQKHLSRKIVQNKKYNILNSKKQEKCRVKLSKIHEYKINFQNHFQYALIKYIFSEIQAGIVVLENLNVAGMIKNRKLSHSIFMSSWLSFTSKLEQKAIEYDSKIVKIDRFFPSSKLCSNCGQIKKELLLSERIYKCDCGLEIDRDLNAAINIRNKFLKDNSLEYSDYKHGEIVRPRELTYNSQGSFVEVFI
jgi:putative transposase